MRGVPGEFHRLPALIENPDIVQIHTNIIFFIMFILLGARKLGAMMP